MEIKEDRFEHKRLLIDTVNLLTIIHYLILEHQTWKPNRALRPSSRRCVSLDRWSNPDLMAPTNVARWLVTTVHAARIKMLTKLFAFSGFSCNLRLLPHCGTASRLTSLLRRLVRSIPRGSLLSLLTSLILAFTTRSPTT
jgi:hypothetical protein